MKVLILDDERAMHTVMKQMLARIDGIKSVDCFMEPADAINFVRREAVDLAFIDIKIGRENGLQAAAQLRALASGMEIVFVTSHKEYALEAFGAYPLDYIVKPISRGRLEMTIARAAARRTQPTGESQSAPSLHVRVLGGFEFRGTQGGNVRWISRKSAELCAYLLLCRGQFVAKGRIIDDIFPDMPLKNAETYLNTAVYQLRKALTPLGMKAIVQSANEQYRLDMSNVEADFVRFDERVQQWNERLDESWNVALNAELSEASSEALSEGSSAYIDEGLALERLYGGALFADHAFHWGFTELYRLEQLYLSFTKRLARELVQHQRYEAAVIVLRRILSLAELDEEANLLLLQAYYEQKDWLALKVHLRQYGALYEQELGLPLPPEARRWAVDCGGGDG